MAEPNRDLEKSLSRRRLQELLHYDPETGEFTWLKVTSNRVRVGSKAGTFHERVDARYVYIGIDRNQFLAHRVAWFYMMGDWPKNEIDHRDGDGWNNRWANLRECKHYRNSYNSKRRTDNKTGIKGIAFYPKNAKPYQVWLNHKYLGSYATLDEAKQARERVAKVAHGEFYRE